MQIDPGDDEMQLDTALVQVSHPQAIETFRVKPSKGYALKFFYDFELLELRWIVLLCKAESTTRVHPFKGETVDEPTSIRRSALDNLWLWRTELLRFGVSFGGTVVDRACPTPSASREKLTIHGVEPLSAAASGSRAPTRRGL